MQPNTQPFSGFRTRTTGTGAAQAHQNRKFSVLRPRDRELVLTHARRLLADDAPGELSALIARATNIGEARIDRIIATEMIAARAEADTLKAAILGGLDAAREARADAIEELG